MVDAQTVGVLVTAVSVTIAAIYYMINLRETTRNRRVSLASTLMQTFISEEGARRWLDVVSAEWSDPKDFEAKYGGRTNPEYFAKRNALWNTMELLGKQYRSGLIDMETIWAICNTAVPNAWAKFKPLIDENRRTHAKGMYYTNFEYLALEVARMLYRADPTYRGNTAYYAEGSWERAFPSLFSMA
jgi:hypothetical protein